MQTTIRNKILIRKGGFSSVYEADFQPDPAVRITQKVVLKYVKQSVYSATESEVLKILTKENCSYNNHLIKEWKESDQGEQYHVFCLQKLGLSLLDFRDRMESGSKTFRANKFSIQCMLQTGIQVTKALKEIHENGYLHLDVKPNNILTAHDFSNGSKMISKIEGLVKNVFLIDYGISERYLDNNGKHLPQDCGYPTHGCKTFMSYNALT